MTTNTTISPRDYKAAHYSTSKVGPALEALDKIDLQVLNYNTDAFTRLTEFKLFLTEINEQSKTIILAGDEQYQARPAELINKAAARLTEIPVHINLEQKKLAAKFESRAMKADELSKRFSAAEIDRIIPPVPQNEIDATAAAVAALEAEAEAIEAFLADAPRYGIALLENTTLYAEEA